MSLDGLLALLGGGLLDLSIWGLVVATLLLTHVTIASVTIYLHRHQAHRGLSLHPIASHSFRFWLWLTTGMSTKEWVAVHRKHHAKCETSDDPHSPQVEGIARVLFGGVGLYRAETCNQETLDVYGRGTPDDWVERNVYERSRYGGFVVLFAIDLLLFGLAGVAVFAVQMLWIPFWAAGVINGIGHYWGYRNFETQDASRNIVPFGILIGGEELHNNHHAYSFSARLSNKWWEIDIGWLYIRLLELLGLAKVKRQAPRTRFEAGRVGIDKETVRAVLGSRFHVLKLYGSRVIAPVLRKQQAGTGFARRQLRRIRRVMTRDEALCDDPSARQWLEEALESNHALRTVLHFKEQLKALWSQSAAGDSDRLKRLQVWCEEAEASGVRALRDFARLLQGYRQQLA